MITLLKKEQFIISVYAFLVLLACSVLLIFNKVQIHLFINEHSSETLDLIFKLFTYLGEGLFVLVVCVMLLFLRYRYALTQVLAFTISGLIAQLLKRFVFSDALRPRAYFENMPEFSLRFVEGVDVASYYSFPSGHTTTAFAFFMIFCFMTNKKSLKLLFMLMATLVGYSRMYLSQHFLIDVTFGSLIGVSSAVLIQYWTMSINKPVLDLSACHHLNLRLRMRN